MRTLNAALSLLKLTVLACALLVPAMWTSAPEAAHATGGQPQSSTAGVTATIDTYGIFRRAKGTDTIKLVKKTDVISGEKGRAFGVMFTVSAPASSAESGSVPVTIHLRHPSLVNPATGARSDHEQWDLSPKNNKSTYTGWEFTSDREIRPGIWLLQIMHGTDLIAEQPFKVILSRTRSRSADDLVINLSGGSNKKNAQSPKKKPVATKPGPEQAEKTLPAPTTDTAPKVKTALKDQATLLPAMGNASKAAPPERPRRTEVVEDPVAVVQVGAFRDKAGAEVVSDMVRDMGFTPSILTMESETGHTFHVVVIGPFDDPGEAQKTANRYRARSQKPARVNFMGRNRFEKLKQ